MKSKFDQFIEKAAADLKGKLKNNPDVDKLFDEAAKEVKEKLLEEQKKIRDEGGEKVKSLLQKYLDEYDSEQVFVIARMEKTDKKNDKGEDQEHVTGMMQGDRVELLSIMAHLVEKSGMPLDKFVLAQKLGLFGEKDGPVDRTVFEFFKKEFLEEQEKKK